MMARDARRRLIPKPFPYSVGQVKTGPAPLMNAMILAAALTALPLEAARGQAQSTTPADRLLDVELPPIVLEEPIILPPVKEPDGALLLPLTPIERFDMNPRDDFKFTAAAGEGLRYLVVVALSRPEPHGDRSTDCLSNQFRHSTDGAPAVFGRLVQRHR